MEERAVDLTDDIGVELFNEHISERSSCRICNSTTLPTSEVVFFFQVAILLELIISSLAKPIFKVLCGEKPVWVSFFSAVVGYLLPSPHL